ncbi:hypothetical protein Tco_0562588 [Tanacetum coccineum]
MLAKNNEAKMMLYNALPKKEYERIFICKIAQEIWQTLIITHQGNSQVKDYKIDLLVQQYEQSAILETSQLIVRAKVTAIEESKDLSKLSLDELIGNLKVYELVMEKDSDIDKGKKDKYKSIALKAKMESSDDETSTSGSEDEEECPKPPRKDQKAIINGSLSDSGEDETEPKKDEVCLMAQESNEFQHEHVVQFGRTSLTGFPAQSVRSSNSYALDSMYLLVLNTGTSQSRQHDMSESDCYYLSD